MLDDIATAPLSDLLVVLAGPRRIGKVALLDASAFLCGRDDGDLLGDTLFAHDGDVSGEDEPRVRAGGLRSARVPAGVMV